MLNSFSYPFFYLADICCFQFPSILYSVCVETTCLCRCSPMPWRCPGQKRRPLWWVTMNHLMCFWRPSWWCFVTGVPLLKPTDGENVVVLKTGLNDKMDLLPTLIAGTFMFKYRDTKETRPLEINSWIYSTCCVRLSNNKDVSLLSCPSSHLSCSLKLTFRVEESNEIHPI